MPAIEFTIDTETGELELRVEGVAGPACGDIARLAQEVLGTPARAENTSEYYLRPQVLQRVQGPSPK